MSKKIQKLILILIILLLGLVISTKVNATNWQPQYVVTGDNEKEDNPLAEKGYHVHTKDGKVTFCIDHGLPYRATHASTKYVYEGAVRERK